MFSAETGCQKPCWDQARLSSLVNRQVSKQLQAVYSGNPVQTVQWIDTLQAVLPAQTFQIVQPVETVQLCCTLRSGLHEISTMIRTFPHGLENNHACKWISDNFPGMLTCVLFLENCLKSICMHGCSPSCS